MTVPETMPPNPIPVAPVAHAQPISAEARELAMLAHDLNNLLTVIVLISEAARHELGPMSPVNEDLSDIGEAAQRATDLVRTLMDRGREAQASGTTKVDEAVARALPCWRALAGEGVDVEARIDAADLEVRIDSTQLDRALLNVVANARDAMANGGAITIHVSRIAQRGSGAEHSGGEMRHVRIAVRDTGCGMDQETLDRAFDPYFTTKPTGNGLGLASVRATIEACGGRVSLVSRPGVGTTVLIDLPRR